MEWWVDLKHQSPWSALIILISSVVLAFCLNFSIFYVIHSATAVTVNLAGNLPVTKKILSMGYVLFEGCGGCTGVVVDIL